MDDADSARVFGRLVTLADSLVSGFDVVDLADELVHSCLEFLPIHAAGILLDDQQGNLRVLASSSEEMRLLELLELQNAEGPCFEAFATGARVLATPLADHQEGWPTFTAAAAHQGIRAAYALPLRLREDTIGALNLFCRDEDALAGPQLEVAHAMTSMATLAILTHWGVRRQELLAEQLQTALNSRIVIEQAKGVIAERSTVDMATAFGLLRTAARNGRRPLSEVAAEVAQGRLSPSALVAPTQDQPLPGPAS
jgi:transcriptional regulator with GAF, ATPase, and Fis domain